MEQNPGKVYAQPGDLAQLAGLGHKNFIIRLSSGKQLQTHRGIVYHDDLIGKPWGSRVSSHLGKPFFLLQPALGDILLEIKRNTQIMYPKDIGYLMVKMGIGSGQNVLEAGTGSGALTTALAFVVGPHGKVISYEVRPEMQKLARENLGKVGLDDRVIFRLRDIATGFDETGIDALFLDLPNPEDFLAQVSAALKPGGFFGCILPTVNQVSRLLNALMRYDFTFIEVCEILLRYYKVIPERLRPTDRMIAHTGYLVFARSILPIEEQYATHANEVGNFQSKDQL
jgi:tRNA (adenine57-N1/adenine58-N1)-methyltransferase